MTRFESGEAAELLNLAPALFCTATLDGRFKTVAHQWETVLEVPAAELIGQPFFQFIHPDDHAATIESMSVLGAGVPVRDFVNRFVSRSGRVVYLSWSSNQRDGVIYAVATDVTNERTMGLLARENASKLELVEEISGVGHWSVQLGDELTVHWSDQVFRIHGLAPRPEAPSVEEAISFYHPEDRDRVAASIERAIATGQSFDFQLRLIRADNQERQVISMGSVRTDEHGAAVAITGVFQDITDRMLMQRRLFDQERLESVSLLASGIAHEINNPLQYITANMSLATRELDSAESTGQPIHVPRLRERLADAKQGIVQVSSIVGDLRAFITDDRRDVADVDLVDVLRTAVTMARGQLRHGAAFEHRVGELPAVRGDAGQLIQVIVNLLLNAGHAVASLETEQAQVSLAAWTSREGYAVIEVEDNGVGIPEENLSRIFEPFFTTRSLGDGTGLGLHVCRRIVDALGGRLDVRSTPGRTTFRVTLLPPPQSNTTLSPDTALGLPTLLVIDDDQLVARVVAMMCGSDFHTRVELNSREALRLLQDEHFDAVICDIMMPIMNGWDMLARLERAHPGIRSRFVMMTGASAERDRPAELLGVPVLEKPFDYQDAVAALQSAIQLSDDLAAAS
ncbi:MAG: signal transduction histidine kinase/ActR/RegA family two-component response regulator [Flavobacteriales bacterium]|jgi:signal transduction histidine kinase/ActR/RegA family two-component response regulator